MRRAVFCVAVAMAAGCNCGGAVEAPDAGRDAGPAADAGRDAGAGSDGGGRLGPGDAGGPRCVGPFDAGVLPTGQLPFSELCEALSAAEVNQIVREATACNEPILASDVPHLIQGRYVDCDGGAAVALLADLAASIDAGRVSYDPQRAFRCRALGRATSYCTEPDYVRGSGEPCEHVFEGLVGLDGACAKSEECAGDRFCRPSGVTSCGGTCVDRLPGSAACDPDRDLCVHEAVCRGGDGGFRCELRAAAGEGCGNDDACAPGLSCVMGRCAAPQPLGASCVDFDRHFDCKAGLGCTDLGSGRTCRPRALLGEPCSPAGNGAPPCLSNCLQCDPNGGRCVAARTAGAACDPANPESCTSPHYCAADRRCAFRGRRGEPCVEAGGERGSCLYLDDYCKSGVCTERIKLGDPCGEAPLTLLCPTGTYCRFTAGDAGVCSTDPMPGEACGNRPGRSQTCTVGPCDLDAGLCRAPLAIGQGCTGTDPRTCVEGAFCDVTQCVAQRDAGAACTTDRECHEGLCDRVSHVCSMQCSPNHDDGGAGCRAGCKNGARDVSLWLLFALVLARRRSTAAGRSPRPEQRR